MPGPTSIFRAAVRTAAARAAVARTTAAQTPVRTAAAQTPVRTTAARQQPELRKWSRGPVKSITRRCARLTASLLTTALLTASLLTNLMRPIRERIIPAGMR